MVEHNLQRTLEDLTATQDEALKQLDIVNDRVRNAKVERDRQAKALYEARKKHENITNIKQLEKRKFAKNKCPFFYDKKKRTLLLHDEVCVDGHITIFMVSSKNIFLKLCLLLQ